MKPQRRCNHGGCRAFVPFNQVYCSKHERKKTYADYDTYENRKEVGGKYFKFYHSKQWENAARIYKLKNPLCEECYRKGIIKKANVTDHIVELKDDWSKRLDEKNYKNLCHMHHNLKTRQEKQRRRIKKGKS